jgi:hypothetical protein
VQSTTSFIILVRWLQTGMQSYFGPYEEYVLADGARRALVDAAAQGVVDAVVLPMAAPSYLDDKVVQLLRSAR